MRLPLTTIISPTTLYTHSHNTRRAKFTRTHTHTHNKQQKPWPISLTTTLKQKTTTTHLNTHTQLADGFRKIPIVSSNGNTVDQRTDIAQFYHVNFMRGQEQRLVSIKRKVTSLTSCHKTFSHSLSSSDFVSLLFQKPNTTGYESKECYHHHHHHQNKQSL